MIEDNNTDEITKFLSKLKFVKCDSKNVIDRIQEAVNRTKNINVFFDDDLRNTPLRLAVIANERSITSLLLMYGADVTAIDRFGNSALHYAAMNKNSEMITLLKKHGATDLWPNLESVTPKDIIELNELNHARRVAVQAACVSGLTVAACCITPKLGCLLGIAGTIGAESISNELPTQAQKSLFFQKVLVHRVPPFTRNMSSSVNVEIDQLRPSGQPFQRRP